MAVASTWMPFRLGREERAASVRRVRRWPVENTFIFLAAFVAYMALADVMVIQAHYMNGDAISRVANAEFVVGSRDPHLGAIGFIWPPLPSLVDIPFLLLSHWWPFLRTEAFAGSVSEAMVGAGSLVLINLALRRVRIGVPLRYLVMGAWLLNPMVALYSAQGMSEGMGLFFMIAMAFCFMKWCDSQSPRDLCILGIVVGLNTLVREESVLLSAVIGIGVIVCSVGRKVSWREIETRALIFGLPVTFLFGGWILAQAILVHNPFYFINASYGNSAQAAASGYFGDLQLQDSKTLLGSLAYVFKQAFLLYPAALVLAALVVARLPFARNRRVGIIFLLMALPVPLLDGYELHQNEYSLQLRHATWVLGWAIMLGLYLVWDMRGTRWSVAPRVCAVAVGCALLVSNLATFDLMDRNDGVSQEYGLIAALENHTSLGPNNLVSDLIDDGAMVATAVDNANKDHGLVAVDSFLAFNVILNANDPTRYVITSDYDFEAVASQPQVYHVEYFLVPAPVGNGVLDHLNVLYPNLWSSGASWAQEVANIGGQAGWKLFRITGPTGEG